MKMIVPYCGESVMKKKQWADRYGAQWYLHYDGIPPIDDYNDYTWNGFQWVIDNRDDKNDQ